MKSDGDDCGPGPNRRCERGLAPGVWTRRAVLAGLGGVLAGCRGGGSPDGDGRMKVLTSFTILADMARNVAGEVMMVESITKPGAEIHGYEPTPQDIVKAQSASLVLWNGLNLEVWFERFFENVRNVRGVVLSEGITPMSIVEGPYTGKPNPHAWMAPANALIYVENIRKALAELDPGQAATFAANAAAYSEKIRGDRRAGSPAARADSRRAALAGDK